MDEQHARRVAAGAPRGQQRLEPGRLLGALLGAVRLARLDQDVEVAHAAQVGGHLAQPASVAPGTALVERGPEHAPGGALPAGGDPHRVELLGLAPLARPGLAGEHPGEVEAQHLAARLGEVVVGQDPGRLGDRQAGRLVLGSRLLMVSDGQHDGGRRAGGRGCGHRLLAMHRGERALELGVVRRDELLDLAQEVGKRLEGRLVAVTELKLQLGEPLDDLVLGQH